MIIVVLRTFIVYALVIIALRLMGKREIGQLQPFELVVIIMISELAAIPSQNAGIPLLSGIIPILVLLLTNLVLAWISLKSEKARELICGTPSILIHHGKISEEQLKNNRYNLTDLLEELRIKDVPNIADVEFAVLETNGQLSVFKKTPKRPPSIPHYVQTSIEYEALPLALIMDGQLKHNNLKESKKDLNWLTGELKKQSIDKIDHVLIASLDCYGILYVQAKQSKSNLNKVI
ncbi:MAG TPA: DUF421 domain-containing protein [Desulfosporosinus sp.]|nr:DUF421 domain-containing protein [Desulfosporosinus sp.]